MSTKFQIIVSAMFLVLSLVSVSNTHMIGNLFKQIKNLDQRINALHVPNQVSASGQAKKYDFPQTEPITTTVTSNWEPPLGSFNPLGYEYVGKGIWVLPGQKPISEWPEALKPEPFKTKKENKSEPMEISLSLQLNTGQFKVSDFDNLANQAIQEK